MEISDVIRNRPLRATAREAFGAMVVGDAREIRGTARERRNLRIYAHRTGYELGMVFRTRTEGEVLVVTRIA